LAAGCNDHSAAKQDQNESVTHTVVAGNTSVTVANEVKHDLSPTLRSMKISPQLKGARGTIPLKRTKLKKKTGAATAQQEEEEGGDRNSIGAGPVADTVSQNNPPGPGTPVPGLGFEGVGDGFTGPDGTYTVNLAPPDNSGEVGPAHYVQMINIDFAIFDKVTGTPVLGPRPNNSLFTGFGGICETTNSGDSVVVYDQLADRWVFSQFALADPNFAQCVAVSQTGDPTGAYFRYQFSYNAFPDYPKMGVWPDAYYETFNMFPSTGFAGAKVCAYDRAKMLQGQPATQQCFDLPTADSVLPSDLDGANPPPMGSPNYMMNFDVSPDSHLNLWKFHVDWNTPANTTLTGPTSIPVAPFAQACNGFGDCIPQPGTSQLLEGLGDRLLFRLAYRNFGDHEALVVTHNVAVGNAVGERWYEVRSPGGTPELFQQGTFAPGNTDPNPDHRWMGSIAMDKVGNIGLGYSISSNVRNPSIFYTGRLFSDPLGEMTAGEGVMIAGPATQSSINRWGDYSQLTLDPTDDCTFWYTNQYQANPGGFNWHTRIGSFQIGPCDTGPPKLFLVTVSPTTFEGGGSATGTVTLTNVAPKGGLAVTLASSNPTLVTVPATVTVPEGKQKATFNITSAQTPTQTDVTITGTLDATNKTATVTLLASPTPTSLTLNPAAVMGGQSSTGTVTLSGPAPAGGAVVTLASSNAAASVPGTLAIAEGATSGDFMITTTEQLVATSSTISASFHGLTKTALLTINRTIAVGNATFDPVLKAPRCTTVDKFCDTGGLIDGRDTILNGNELNQPNTINNSCADGTVGAYHSDESQDRLKISTVDGTPLAAGKMVKVDATVFGFAGGGDSWDLWFAPDANNPVWTILTTQPQMGSGLQVLTSTFVLPNGPLPAIRGVWRFVGSNAFPCSGGSFDEADDLIFAIGSDGGGDMTPPTAHIDSPIDGAIQGGGVLVNATAMDNVGVVKVEMLVDGVVIQTDLVPPYQFSFTQPEGPHTLQVKAYDAAGNTGLSQVVNIVVDVTAPVTAITSPASGAMLTGVTTVTATSMDLHAITKVELYVNNMLVATDTAAPYSFQLDTSMFPAGSTTLKAAGYDVAGNSAFSPDVNVTIVVPKQYSFFEAESATLTAGTPALQLVTDATASGGKAVQIPAGNNSQAAPPATGHGKITFTANVAGQYKVWGRLIDPTTADDSWWVRIDTGTWARWNGIPLGTTYHWDDVHDDQLNNGAAIIYTLTAGTHTLEFAYREDGTKLDRWLITNDLMFTPTGSGPPAAPTNVNATAGDTQVSLSWTAPFGAATSYNVKRGNMGGPYTTVKSGVTTTSTVDTGLTNGTQYCYVISGVNANGEGPNSSEKCATPVAPSIPPAPKNVTALAGNNQVTVMWSPSAGATNYNVKRSVMGGPFTFLKNVTTVSHIDTTAMNGTQYCYVVSALNGAGESMDSTPAACATPTALTYLYPQAESATLTATAPALQKVNDANASGGQAVQIPTGNTATDPNNPPATGHGKITFSVTQAGNYKVWGRVTAPTTAHDSWWVRIDTGVWRRWNGIPAGATYHWDDVHDDRPAPTGTGGAAVIFNLTTGNHTLEFAYREDGTRLDRFLITNDLTFTPSGTGP
jgi:hypothetical protein